MSLLSVQRARSQIELLLVSGTRIRVGQGNLQFHIVNLLERDNVLEGGVDINHVAPLRGTIHIRRTRGVAHEAYNINLRGQLLAGCLINSRILVLQGKVRLVTVQVRETVGISGRPVVREVGAFIHAVLRCGTVNAHQAVVVINNIERLFDSQVLRINDSLIRVSVGDLLSL